MVKLGGNFMTDKNKATFKIAGIEYTLRGQESQEHMHRLGLLVDNRMSEVTKNNNKLSTCMAAVLTALNVANDYIKAQEEFDKLQKELVKAREQMEIMRAENERVSNENAILVSSNTQLQLESIRNQNELNQVKKYKGRSKENYGK